ncbi:hypothetical protein ACQP2Y_20965 [Actinoplanes sp. CA-051413]|uniref:hypothetical protein n=1 Tax=Actinoplanes sp. CA-051413 TaxID=3239899 RepID=UPI003D9845CE
MTTDLDLIDQAIAKLVRLVDTCSPGPWVRGGYGDFGWTVHTETTNFRDGLLSIETADSDAGRADAEFIATLNPITANALIGLLTVVRDRGVHVDAAVVLAQAILHHGGEQR